MTRKVAILLPTLALCAAVPAYALMQHPAEDPDQQGSVSTERTDSPEMRQLTGYEELNPKELRKLRTYLKDRKPGKAVSCIPHRSADNYTAVSDDILVFGRKYNRTIYVNQPYGGCNDAADNTLVSIRYSSSLCTGDIVQVYDLFAGVTTGSCSYNRFVPWVRESD